MSGWRLKPRLRGVPPQDPPARVSVPLPFVCTGATGQSV